MEEGWELVTKTYIYMSTDSATHFDPEEGGSIYHQNITILPIFAQCKDPTAESVSRYKYLTCLSLVLLCVNVFLC
jgi:hypothetical protein